MDMLLDTLPGIGPSVASVPILDEFDRLPFVPLDAFGMTSPGDAFIAHAQALTSREDIPLVPDAPDDVIQTRDRLVEFRHREAVNLTLERLYRAALYGFNFFLPMKIKGKIQYARFIPGHRWGDRGHAAGPGLSEPVEVMVIGKCPGVEEERQCRNMVGENGNIFAEVLREVGVPVERFARWYMTNLVKHPNLDPTKSQMAKGWIKNCQLLIEEEIRLLQPKFVLCLGREASNWMLGGEVPGGASTAAGRVMSKRIPLHLNADEEPRWHEFQYMTCLQPVAIKKTPDRRPELRSTLFRFWQLVTGELDANDASEQIDHRVIWTEDELRSTVDRILAEHAASGQTSQPIAIDCEWHGEYWSSCNRDLKGELAEGKRTARTKRDKRTVSIEKGEKESWLRTIQFSHRPGFARTIVLRYGGRRSKTGDDLVGLPAFVPTINSAIVQFKRLMTPTPGRKVRLIGHNLKADLPWLHALDRELGEMLIEMYNPPWDDPDPDGVTRLFGWQKAMTEGGFDSLWAIHSHQETAERKLEVAAMNFCGVRRYDGEVQKERKAICDALGLSPKKMGGYGEISDDNLHRYGNWDADGTIRLFFKATAPGGLLDRDQYGHNSWRPFWISQAKLTAELEMEMTGLLIDHKRAEKLTAIYKQAYDKLLKKLQVLIGWEEKIDPLTDKVLWEGFNPRSVQQTRTVLFGPELAGKIDNNNGDKLDPRPEQVRDCMVLGLRPIKTTGKPSKGWDKVIAKKQEDLFSPSTDKETLGILLARARLANDEQAVEILQTLRWYRFINRVVTGVLCPPDDASGCHFDEDGDMVFEKGVMAAVEWDRRVRTHYLPVDTGRVGSTAINQQNFAKRREADLRLILESDYTYPLRSIVTCPDGWVLVEADFTGAELMQMAIQSGSAKMVDHCRRANLPESDPLHYDIHSRIAKVAFRFAFEPLKSVLEANEMIHLRDITKTLVFGIPYGRGDEAVLRAIEETGTKVEPQDIIAVRAAIFTEYPELEPYFEERRNRAVKPGWMATFAGRRRRFQLADDMAIEDLKRIAGNFDIQGGIADCTSLAIALLHRYPGRRDEHGMRYRLNAQIHDAVMAEVRIDSLRWYLTEVLPDCMTKNVPIYRSNADGDRLSDEVFHLGFEATLYKHWGVKLYRDEGVALGIDADLLPKAKKKKEEVAA